MRNPLGCAKLTNATGPRRVALTEYMYRDRLSIVGVYPDGIMERLFFALWVLPRKRRLFPSHGIPT